MDNKLNTNETNQNFRPNLSNEQNNNQGMQDLSQTNNTKLSINNQQNNNQGVQNFSSENNINSQSKNNLQTGQNNVELQNNYIKFNQSNLEAVDTKLTEEEKGTISAVENLNKEDAMEEALSHTNQYPPFQEPKQEINKESENKTGKFSFVFVFIILAILALFIFNLPAIAKLFGW